MGCQDTNTIINNGGRVIENNDGTVSVYILDESNTLLPTILTKQCCLVLNPSYSFDINTQKCLWKEQTECSLEDTFKITLNPNGNAGSIFYVDDDENCGLKIEFDYLIKIKCETLSDLLNNETKGFIKDSELSDELKTLQSSIEENTVKYESLENQIQLLTEQINKSNYSIFCYKEYSSSSTVSSNLTKSFSKTGFGESTSPNNTGLKINEGKETKDLNVQFCLTEPHGLTAWSQILGENNFNSFIQGVESSYTCDHVMKLIVLNEELKQSTPDKLLIFECDTPFGFKTSLIRNQNNLIQQQREVEILLNSLISSLENLQVEEKIILSSCQKPIDFFETLDLSLTLDIINTGNTLETVYEDNTLFPEIGSGQLYQYLTTTTNSGFYVCGGENCQPLILNISGETETNTSLCDIVSRNILNDLILESNLPESENGLPLSSSAFVSQWVSHSLSISDPEILSLIYNKEIKFSIKINHTCGDVCVLIDNIRLSKECTKITERKLFVSKSPGFELEKITDNKKSWLENDVTREFNIKNLPKTDVIRETKYNVNDDRLVINTKEIDLDVNLSSAIETDVFSFLKNNPCILTGLTNCNPCDGGGIFDYKQFQDDEYMEFMDDSIYEFMDSDIVNGNDVLSGKCCGDNRIKFDTLTTTKISGLTTLEDFNNFLTSELIDVKNRQTISKYATLKALYDRYLNSYKYCGVYSSAFVYYSMEEFADLLGNYWVDIIEQVVPSTTIWGSVRVYSNTVFDQQKFKYKAYSSLFCENPYFGDSVLSPINGTSGLSENVEVITSTLTKSFSNNSGLTISNTSICDKLYITQMNSGSEFIGRVSVVDSSTCNDGITINECLMQVNVFFDGYKAIANVENAALPVLYEWSNGSVEQFSNYGQPGQYSLTVTDANCCSTTIDFEMPVIQTACWYTNPDSQTFIDGSFLNFTPSAYTYTMRSFIVNGVELITSTEPSYVLTASNFQTIMTPAGLTYTNFVKFLNQSFETLGLPNYSAQIALNGDLHGKDNQGFYIIRPLDDTFSMQISETSSVDYYISDDGILGPYMASYCTDLTVINGVVIE